MTGGEGDPLIALTALWDMVGFPVAALPVADTGPMPVSVSVVAPSGGETIVTQVAIDLQEHAWACRTGPSSSARRLSPAAAAGCPAA